MGLFDLFKKKECCICGDEVGLLGNRKLEDGNMCSKCAKKLSPWFEDRRSSTVAQIKEQLAYREENARQLKDFTVARVIGEAEKMYIEEANGVPTRFFVTDAADYLPANPDILSFRDVISCVTDIDIRDEELHRRNKDGEQESYDPPRFKHHHNFYITMEIRNNPWFEIIRFRVNSGVVTLETEGGLTGLEGAVVSGLLKGTIGGTMGIQRESYDNAQARRRYEEYANMCKKIEQAVEDGKRGTAADPMTLMLEQLRNAPDPETAMQLCTGLAAISAAAADPAAASARIAQALAEAKNRFSAQAVTDAPPAPQAPKFCPNCGAPCSGGKFCEHCGTKL